MSSEAAYWKREAQRYKAALRKLTEVVVKANTLLLKETTMSVELVVKPEHKEKGGEL